MGKRQHQKDKMYLTYTEWTTLYGGKKSGYTTAEEDYFKRLPFDHCCLSLQPWEIPYCDLDGNIFDLEPLLPFLKKFKINPVTGKPLDFKSLVQLNFHKNEEGEFECPVLYKQFTKSSHIVAIATTGNVYLMEAVEQLNIKNKNWKDLISDTPFERKDIIMLQDPLDLNKFNISNFHHVKNNLRIETEEEIKEKNDPQGHLKNVNPETKYTLEELKRDYKEPTIEINKVEVKEKADKFNAAHYSTGAVAASFTSTAMVPRLVHEAAVKHEDEVRYDRVKKKGYVRLITNLGPLNLEIYCDEVPRASENFIRHCASGYYNGTKFHRSIRNFMVQGGDPTGTGTGGESIWGKKFVDEFRPNLQHVGRGVLSMANSGKNTNGSQFFITYRSCKHLNNKHTIFGRLVGGMETLNEMEKIEVDNKDKPIEDIVLIRAQVFVNPFEEADEQLAKEREEELKRQKEEEEAKRRKAEAQKTLKVYKSGVGKYINPDNVKSSTLDESDLTEPQQKKKKKMKFTFNDW
ncbi:RING-type E3 ubiquitin-protein ligase PPIL2 [Tribolium castaneum]|uniref:RING-type E3 ubiquitin-protein ligase PPIL2 n=1 Tax=Tribolium castaneum TaxID=7070 RepID=D6X1Y7_TRICA|nr:PREDICTED: peptidyl-prolyl cis-trans isomerase-like 2 [Tribolium castaneum]EFA10186.1 Peptidyl-prolyl cis-trans isomerase-like 2 [Tribolium castaneum]|eukprot:XP_971236.1 PREDICTED: peptidyl-prolyl cis-trans isomerase-like 2 [Tribolium castaneum]